MIIVVRIPIMYVSRERGRRERSQIECNVHSSYGPTIHNIESNSLREGGSKEPGVSQADWEPVT